MRIRTALVSRRRSVCPGILSPAICSPPYGTSSHPLSFQHSTLNFEPSTASSAQPSSFQIFVRSFAIPKKSPLCFHTLTNTFSCNPFSLTSLQKHRGCHPAADQLFEPILGPVAPNSNSANHSASSPAAPRLRSLRRAQGKHRQRRSCIDEAHSCQRFGSIIRLRRWQRSALFAPRTVLRGERSL